MKISTIQAVAMMIWDHSSYFSAGFAAASVQRLWSGGKHEAVSKSRYEESYQKYSVLTHSKIVYGLFPWCFQGDYVFNAFFIASQSNCNTSLQLLKTRTFSPPFCEVPCETNRRQLAKRNITMTHVWSSAPWGQSRADVPELVSAARSAASVAHCQSCLINT